MVTWEKHIAFQRRGVQRGRWNGRVALLYLEEIKSLCKKHAAKTVLNFGCGERLPKGEGLGVALNLPVTPYDPAFEEYDRLPCSRYDCVICTDVLEHVPEEHLNRVLTDIFVRANKFVFISVCCRKAKFNLTRTRNAHATVKPESWWLYLIAHYSKESNIPATVRISP